MFKKILVATDLSDTSGAAMKSALALMSEQAATLVALHVVHGYLEPAPWAGPLSAAEERTIADVDRRIEEGALASLRAQLEASGPHVRERVEPLVRRGNPVDVIVRYADAWGADLVVVGSHGRTGLGHALLGSIAERIARAASCAVLVVKSPAAAAKKVTRPKSS